MNYLGVVFNYMYTGSFALNQEMLFGKGLKALNLLCLIQKPMYLHQKSIV